MVIGWFIVEGSGTNDADTHYKKWKIHWPSPRCRRFGITKLDRAQILHIFWALDQCSFLLYFSCHSFVSEPSQYFPRSDLLVSIFLHHQLCCYISLYIYAFVMMTVIELVFCVSLQLQDSTQRLKPKIV